MPPGGSQDAGYKRSRSGSIVRRGGDSLRRLQSRRIPRQVTINAPYRFVRHGETITVKNVSGPVFDNTTIVTAGSAVDDFNSIQFGWGQFFALSQVSNYTEFTRLFDQYRIDKIVLNFKFQANAVDVTQRGGAKGGILPILYYTQDLDDGTAPASQDDLLQYQQCKSRILNGNDAFSMVIKPGVSRQVYQGATSGYEMARSPKIDNGYPDVQHYGIKCWVRNWMSNGVATDDNCKLTMEPVYHLSMFNVR